MIKVRFEDGPHPGLKEYVATRQVLCPWGQREAVVRDEERAARFAEHAREVRDHALAEAASAVLESTGEQSAYCSDDGAQMSESDVQRILDRAGLTDSPADLHPVAYQDRSGLIHLPLDAAVRLAKSFAAAEPQTVVSYIDDEEDELRIRGNAPGERWFHQYLREMSPGYAVARQWAGLEQEAELLRKEISRLRSLVSSAAYDLKDAGKERKARTLLRALDGRG
jgi:hypothetical protein